MGWLEGLLTGYQDRSHTLAAEKMQEAIANNQREAALYQTMLNSEDPEQKAMATIGMLQSGDPRRRRGGLQGWMGEMAGNPVYPKVIEYFKTPKEKVTTSTQTSLPSTQTSGYLPTPPGQTSSMAMPATSPTQAGTPPPTPPSPTPTAEPTMTSQFAAPAAVNEPGFKEWYADAAKRLNLDPNPDDPRHQYNYRAAYAAGVTPPTEPGGHWPSPYKMGGHPNMIVGGFNTQTGERVPAYPRAGSVDELVQLGWSPTAATQLMAQPEPVSPDVGTPPESPFPGLGPPTPVEPPPGPQLSVTYDAQGNPLVQGAMTEHVVAPTTMSLPSPAKPYQQSTSTYSLPTLPSQIDLKVGLTRGDIRGKLAEYAEMYKAANPGMSDEEAAKQAADFYHDVLVRQTGGSGGFGPYAMRAKAELFPGKSWDDVEAAGGMAAVNQKAGEMAAKDAATKTTETGAAKRDVGLDKPQRVALLERQSTKWDTYTKDTRAQHTAVTQMKTALNAIEKRGDWAPGAEAIIVKWQKALDPTSVVREAEADRPGAFQGLVARAEAALARLYRGGSNVNDIAAYVQLADEMQQATATELRTKRKQITAQLKYADETIDPYFVFVDSPLGLEEGEQPLTDPSTRAQPGAAGPAPAAPAAPAPAASETPAPAAPETPAVPTTPPATANSPLGSQPLRPTVPRDGAAIGAPPPRSSAAAQQPRGKGKPGTLDSPVPGGKIFVDRAGNLVVR